MPAVTSSLTVVPDDQPFLPQYDEYWYLTLDFTQYVDTGFLEPDNGVMPQPYYSRSPADLAESVFTEDALLPGGTGARDRKCWVTGTTSVEYLVRTKWRGTSVVDVFGTPSLLRGNDYLIVTFEGEVNFFGGLDQEVGVPFELPSGAVTALSHFMDPAPTHIVFFREINYTTLRFAFVRNALPTATWNRWQPYPYRLTKVSSGGGGYACPIIPSELGGIPARFMWFSATVLMGIHYFGVGDELWCSPYTVQEAVPFGLAPLSWGVPTTIFCGHSAPEPDSPSVTDFGLSAEYFDALGNSLGSESIAEWPKVTGAPDASYMTVLSADRPVTMNVPANARWYHVTAYWVVAGVAYPIETFTIDAPARPRQLPAPYRNPLDGCAIAGQVHTGQD